MCVYLCWHFKNTIVFISRNDCINYQSIVLAYGKITLNVFGNIQIGTSNDALIKCISSVLMPYFSYII